MAGNPEVRMHLAIYLPLVTPLLAAVAAWPLAERLPPAAAIWLLVLSSVALAAVSTPTRMRRAGPVPRRVAALLRLPPELQPLLLAAAVLLVAVAGVSAPEAARDLHALLESARAAGAS